MPLITAAWIRIGGDAAFDRMALLAALFATVTAWVIYRLGERHGGRISAAAAALFTPRRSPRRRAPRRLALARRAALEARDRRLARPRPRARSPAGSCSRLATLTRPELLIALPLGAWACPPRAARVVRRRSAARGGAVVVAQPARLGIAVLQPVVLPRDRLPTGRGARDVPLRDLRAAGELAVGAATRAARLAAKWGGDRSHAARWMLRPRGSRSGGWPRSAPRAMLSRPRRRARGRGRASMLALVPLAVMTLTVPASRYMVPFLPLWCLAAARSARAALAVRWRPQASPGVVVGRTRDRADRAASVIALSGRPAHGGTLRSRLGSSAV